MSKLRLILAVPVVVGLALISDRPASATGSHGKECTVVSVGKTNTAGNRDSRFVLSKDGTVSAAFEVKGKDCKEPVVLATWQAPDGDKGRPYELQKLFAHKNGTFAEGKHTLTVKMPDCFYQVDLARGLSPTGPNSSAVYEKGRLMGSLHGGTKKCDEPKKPETPKQPDCPPEKPKTPEKPKQPEKPKAPDCPPPKPKTPETPKPPEQPKIEPKAEVPTAPKHVDVPAELPSTGATGILLGTGLVSAATAGIQYARQARRNRK